MKFEDGSYRVLKSVAWRRLVVLAVAFSVSLASMVAVQAQSSDRRQMMDDFYKEFQNITQDQQELRDHQREANPALMTHQANVTPEQLRQIQRVLPMVAREADQFADLLDQNMNRTPRIRSVWPKVLQLRARINYLSQQSGSSSNPSDMVAQLKSIDRDWRVIANYLEQTRDLDRRVLESVERLNTYSKQISQSLSIDPQLDRTQLVQQTASLSAGINNLLEDVEFEVPDLAERNRLILEGQRLEQQVRHVSYLVSGTTDPARVIDYYKRFQKDWYPYAASLRRYNSKYLERSVRRISSADMEINQLLWLPHQVDRSRLLYVTTSLERELDEFFTRAPLKLLISLPDSDMVISTSSQFYGVCENFIDGVNAGESISDLADSYRYVEDGWRDFISVFRPIKSQKARLVLTDIEKGVLSLRDALQVTSGGGVDQHELANVAAQLEVYVSNLGYDLRSWVTERRPTFYREVEAEHKKFVSLSQHMHEALIRGESAHDLRRDAEDLSESWRRLYGYVRQCNSSHRDSMLFSASKITPAIIELRSALLQ